MKDEEKRLEAEVRELLRQAQEVDEEEDHRYGKGKRGDELPQELAFRESRLRKIREAKAALEAEAREETQRARAEGKPHPGVPDDKAQRNFTDPSPASCPPLGAATSCRAITPRWPWTAPIRSSWPVRSPASLRTRGS